ncbi:MAG: WD40 repeat domain-containing protein, partial [Gemmataceae bacterium]
TVSRRHTRTTAGSEGPGLVRRGLNGVKLMARGTAATGRFLWRNYTPRRALAASVLLVGIVGALYFYISSLANQTDPEVVQPSGKLDRYGDPLPVDARARLGTQRFRAPNNVGNIAISPDCKLVAATSSGNEVIVWDLETGKEIQKLEGNQGDFQRLAFANDNKTLAAADSENTIGFWDLSSGKKLRRLRGHQGRVTFLEFAPRGDILASVSNDRNDYTVRIWNTTTDDTLQVLNHQGYVYRMAFAPDGKTLATSCSDRKLRAWNVEDGKQRYEIDWPRTASYTLIAFSGDGKQLLAGATDGIHRWDAATGQPQPNLTVAGKPTPVNGLVTASTKPLLATWYSQQPLRLWDSTSGQQLFELEESMPRTPTAYSFNADGSKLIFVDNLLSITIWSTTTGKRIFQNDGHGKSIRNLVFSSDSKQLASAGTDGTVRYWNTETGEALYRPLYINVSQNTPFGFTDDNKHMLVSTGIFEPTAPVTRAIRSFPLKAPLTTSTGILFPDGEKALLIKTTAPQAVGVIDLKGNIQHVFPDAKPTSGLMALAANGKYAAVNCQDGIRIWNLADNYKQLKTIPGDSVFLLAFAPDGKTLAAADNRFIHLWNVESGQKLGQLDAGGISLSTLAFTSDGKHVFGGDDSGYLYVWKVGTEKHAHHRRAHNEGITALALSPDGKTLATGSNDTTILLWEAGKLVEAAK